MVSFNIEQLPQTINFSVFSGDDFTKTISLHRDITNYTLEAKIENGETDISFTVTKTDAANGVFTIALSAVQTAAIVNGAKWSLKWTYGGKVLTILTGIMTVKTL